MAQPRTVPHVDLRSSCFRPCPSPWPSRRSQRHSPAGRPAGLGRQSGRTRLGSQARRLAAAKAPVRTWASDSHAAHRRSMAAAQRGLPVLRGLSEAHHRCAAPCQNKTAQPRVVREEWAMTLDHQNRRALLKTAAAVSALGTITGGAPGPATAAGPSANGVAGLRAGIDAVLQKAVDCAGGSGRRGDGGNGSGHLLRRHLRHTEPRSRSHDDARYGVPHRVNDQGGDVGRCDATGGAGQAQAR